ncbi:MAG TPA: EamA family transporter [Xanthobacteraceae bacterium]|jgi:drug/metabolite transporter (DMT)-like permease|nr:EamA family transporter [Xanthobacteraceae bacterium]
MTSDSHIRFRLVLGLAFGIALDTAIQLIWKIAVIDIPEASAVDTLVAVLRQPMVFLLVFLMFCQLVNWLKVLDHADLSFAKPITSLSYVSVAGLSVIWLGEYLHPVQLVGIVVVLAGVWCITRTERSSFPTEVPVL